MVRTIKHQSEAAGKRNLGPSVLSIVVPCLTKMVDSSAQQLVGISISNHIWNMPKTSLVPST